LSDEELLSIGITPGTLRISVGIEDIEDLIADFQQALQVIEK
jgi:cystathionine beta-lyase/cystathionine gamma-synthase